MRRERRILDGEWRRPPKTSHQTGVYLGRGYMRIHTCPTDRRHPHRLSFQ
ncbi:hypothetical protein [Streptomyces sp. NPDC000410]